MSVPNSPAVRNSSIFFAEEDENGGLKTKSSSKLADEKGSSSKLADEKDSSGSRSSGDWFGIHGEIQQNYQILQRQLSQEFQQ